MTSRLLIAVASTLIALAMICARASADDSAPNPEELFAYRVLPLLQTKCFACHGNDPADVRGGLSMLTRAALVQGGESETPALVTGKPEESPLYLAATRASDDWSAMPPKENDRLSAEQLAWLRQWIAAGAPWPDADKLAEIVRRTGDKWNAADGVQVATSGGLSAEWTNRRYKPEALWAYRPLRKPDGLFNSAQLTRLGEQREAGNYRASVGRPGPLSVQWSIRTRPTARNPIDVLIDRRLEQLGLEPAPLADPRTLIRRLTFDLTGLPPTVEEVEEFIAKFSPSLLPSVSPSATNDREIEGRRDGENTYNALIDRLLASPHYGEHWARHWLDVARYADTSGFANDYERGNAWRYRDYVVRSFNDDKPFDQFVREQIAGDELDPHDPEMLVATGFLRMGPWELTGMEVARLARQRFLDDVTNSIGETFLAHSLQCARCHDHKFDPVPTRDYYSVQATLATTQLAERPAPFLAVENTANFAERKHLEARRAEHLAELQSLDQVLLHNAQRWFAEQRIDPADWNQAVEEARRRPAGAARREFVGLFDAARGRLQTQGVAEGKYPPKLIGFSPQEFGRERVARKGLERLRWELERYEPFALAVYDGRTPEVKSVTAPQRVPRDPAVGGELEQTCILTGGDPFSPAAPVRPGVLSAVAAFNPGLAANLPDTIDGRRRALAEWIAHPANPLTARVIANRVWLWHFGQPLAGNPNNFGSTGKRPTHPELLDFLAIELIEHGWSLKHLHRLILTSDAYRRSCEHPDRKLLAEKDPLGESYAVFKPRRLTAEELRDSMLLASGELNRTLGGIPNRPEINLEVALQPRQVMGTFASAWTPNPRPEQRHRRSLYALKIRGLRDPFVEVFNEPGPDFSCEVREVSTVTPQVFCLFNSQSSADRSLALAACVLREAADDEGAISRVFQRALGREPSADERRACLEHWRRMTARHGSLHFARPSYPTRVVREAIEENTGEKFSFEERLTAYEEFVPDLKPADVDARTRALADVCLVILNSNEFAYVY